MVAPAPAPDKKKTIDECLADFHGCMTTSTLAPAPRAPAALSAKNASGYALEGSPFGGVISTGLNTKLILTLLVLAILLWILAKNM